MVGDGFVAVKGGPAVPVDEGKKPRDSVRAPLALHPVRVDVEQSATLAEAYREYRNTELLPFYEQGSDATRRKIDEAVCASFGWDENEISKVRESCLWNPLSSKRREGKINDRERPSGRGGVRSQRAGGGTENIREAGGVKDP